MCTYHLCKDNLGLRKALNSSAASNNAKDFIYCTKTAVEMALRLTLSPWSRKLSPTWEYRILEAPAGSRRQKAPSRSDWLLSTLENKARSILHFILASQIFPRVLLWNEPLGVQLG